MNRGSRQIERGGWAFEKRARQLDRHYHPRAGHMPLSFACDQCGCLADEPGRCPQCGETITEDMLVNDQD